jgi:glycosyltransferase involved in cell wall biosynthesis
MKILLTNNKLREKMQKEKLKKARAFLWEKIAIELEKCYTSLIKP